MSLSPEMLVRCQDKNQQVEGAAVTTNSRAYVMPLRLIGRRINTSAEESGSEVVTADWSEPMQLASRVVQLMHVLLR